MPHQIPKNLLRISSENGAPINEYRIHQGLVEFRSLDPRNKLLPQPSQGWRSLEVCDIQLHFALKTVVAQWLIERLSSMPEEEN